MLGLVDIGLGVLDEKMRRNFSMNFHYFVIISPWKRVGAFITTKFHENSVELF